jgi:hypothetical protein
VAVWLRSKRPVVVKTLRNAGELGDQLFLTFNPHYLNSLFYLRNNGAVLQKLSSEKRKEHSVVVTNNENYSYSVFHFRTLFESTFGQQQL